MSDTTTNDTDDMPMDADIYDQTTLERNTAENNFGRYYYVRGRGHLDYIDEANQFDRFYRGDQWSVADKKALDDEGRPAMTVNIILSAINSVKGAYSGKRVDFKYKPKRDGANVTQAMLLNKVVMHETEDMGYDDLEADMFEDGLITDRGFLDIRMSEQDNVAGDIEVTLRDPRSVIPDPDASNYDPKTWGDVIVSEFLSLDEISIKFGAEKAATARSMIDIGGYYKQDSVEFYEETTFGDDLGYSTGANDGGFYGNSDQHESKRVKSIRVIDRQYWKVGTFKYFVDSVTGDKVLVPLDWNEERMQMHAQKYQLEIITKQERKVRWTISADKTLLFDEWSPYSTFTIVPFFPYFRRGHPVGMVRNLINPQEILNKATSQQLHIVNTTANSGWVVESGSLANMTVDDLAKKGSKTGIVIETNPGREAPQKIQPNQIPSGISAVGNEALNSMYEISGVNRAMVGQEGTSISGVALENKQSSGLLQLQPVFDNLSRTRRMIGSKFLELIQGFYTDERIFMIADYTVPNAQPEELAVNQQVEDEQGQITIENDLTLGTYSVAVSTTPARDVYSESQFAEVMTLREVGIPIPDYRVIEYSSLDKKEEMAEELKQMAGLAPPTEEEAQLLEMEKQAQIKLVQIQIESAAAEVELKQANAQLAQAKAMEASDKPGLEREKLELEMTITAIEQATRERVNKLKELSSQMNNITKQRGAMEQTRAKILGDIITKSDKPKPSGAAQK